MRRCTALYLLVVLSLNLLIIVLITNMHLFPVALYRAIGGVIMLIAILTICATICAVRRIIAAFHAEIRAAEERGARTALNEVIRRASSAPQSGQGSREYRAGD
jgi:predicted ferric reductase